MTASGWGKYLGCAVVLGLLALVEVSGASARPAEWGLLVYVSEQADLPRLGERYLRYLERVRHASQITAVAEVVTTDSNEPGEVRGQRYFFDKVGQRHCQVVELSEASQGKRIANLIKWGMQQAVAKRYALVVVGHGQVAPTLASEQDRAGASFLWLDLQVALSHGVEGSAQEKLDALFLDCCFGVTVEVAAKLAGTVRYLVGTPGLMYSPGLPWDEILSWLIAHPGGDGRALAQQAVASLGDMWQHEPDVAISLIAIDMSRAAAVGRRLRALVAGAQDEMPAIIPEITLARSRAESWGTQSELVDLGGFATALGGLTAHGGVAQQARQLARATRRAIVASYLQGPLAPVQVRDQGLAVFFPLGREGWPAAYGQAGKGQTIESWLPFLNSYLSGLQAAGVAGAMPEVLTGQFLSGS